MAFCGSFWLFCGSLSLFVAFCGFLWLFMAFCGFLWLLVAFCVVLRFSTALLNVFLICNCENRITVLML